MTIADCYAIVGSVIIVLLLSIPVVGISAVIVDKLVQQWQILVWEHDALKRRELGARLKQEAYWFAEYPDAMSMLEVIGDYLHNDNLPGRGYMGDIRDVWEKNHKKLNPWGTK